MQPQEHAAVVRDNEVMLTLPDGRQLMPDGRVLVPKPQPAAEVAQEILTGRKAKETLQRIHRKLGDLPDLPVKMNPIAAIVTYTHIGLSNEDIATALGATEEQVKAIKHTEAYMQIEEMFDRTVFEDQRRNARHIIAKAADRAAQRMVEAVDSDREDIAVVASRDVLKMNAISLEQDHTKLPGGLKIIVENTERGKTNSVTVQLGE